jgi:hypothetical protein
MYCRWVGVTAYRTFRVAGVVAALTIALFALMPASDASTVSSRVLRAVVRPTDISGGVPTYVRPGPYRTPLGLMNAWNLPPDERPDFVPPYQSAGFRLGSLGYVQGPNHVKWITVAAVLGSSADAIDYIDGMHDFYLAGGYYSVSGDGTTPHAFRLFSPRTKNLDSAVTIYAVQGDLVILLQAARPDKMPATTVQRVMERILGRVAGEGARSRSQAVVPRPAPKPWPSSVRPCSTLGAAGCAFS